MSHGQLVRRPGRLGQLQAAALLALAGLLAGCSPASQPTDASSGASAGVSEAPSATTAGSSATPAAAAASPAPPVGLKVGERAPAFTLAGLDGQPVTSADLLAQEKPFVLFFFATW